ncbi:MAG TPA: hypothetical protein VN939_23645 [Chthoniobacterales bacterium]|jgi:hypothetical protein|nr:hypothetical protein [Chthoniobacterales bacterium]
MLALPISGITREHVAIKLGFERAVKPFKAKLTVFRIDRVLVRRYGFGAKHG